MPEQNGTEQAVARIDFGTQEPQTAHYRFSGPVSLSFPYQREWAFQGVVKHQSHFSQSKRTTITMPRTVLLTKGKS